MQHRSFRGQECNDGISGLWSTPLATRLVQASVLNEPLRAMQLPDIYRGIWVISSLSWMACPVLEMQILWDGGSRALFDLV